MKQPTTDLRPADRQLDDGPARARVAARAPRSLLALLLISVLLVAGCVGGGGATPGPTDGGPGVTPGPSVGPVTTPEQAAALVLASDPRFAGIGPYDPDLIGQAAWWTAQPTADGYAVTVRIGWGDCQAGCINEHIWEYTVTVGGAVTLVSESGDELPPGGVGGGPADTGEVSGGSGLWKRGKPRPWVAYRPLVFFPPGLSSAEFRVIPRGRPDRMSETSPSASAVTKRRIGGAGRLTAAWSWKE